MYQRFVAETADARAVNPAGTPVPQLLPIFPTLDAGPATSFWHNGPWAVAASGGDVVVGGEFLTVNGVPQQGLTHFTLRTRAPKKSGPLSARTPQVASTVAGTAVVRWPASWDRDSPTLTSQVFRDAGGTPVHTVTTAARSGSCRCCPGPTPGWRRAPPTPTGSAPSTRTATWWARRPPRRSPSRPPPRPPGRTRPRSWPPGRSTTGGSAPRPGPAPTRPARPAPARCRGRTRAEPGALPSDADTATGFEGSAAGAAGSTVAELAPQQFSLEAWFSTTSTAGGKIVGFGNGRGAQQSTSADRQLYLMADGRLVFGVYQPGTGGGIRTIATTSTYRDGRWHHVVGALGGGTLALYVDGALVGQAAVPSASPYYGFWHVGGDVLGPGWTTVYTNCVGKPTCLPQENWPWATSPDLAGSIDEVAVYPVVLTAAQVLDHWFRGVR